MTTKNLGGFEHQVLLAVLRLGGAAHSAPIVLEMEDRGRQSVSPAAVYIALRRLERRGLVTSHSRPPEEGERGRPRRVFAPTPRGLRLLKQSRETLLRYWQGLEPDLERS
ncbi:MAG: PadR family transcriptional regulator [Gemmatimonadales bacterium]